MRIRCPSCSARLNAKPEVAGDKIPCPKCGKSVLVPELDEFDEDELVGQKSKTGSRKLVYVQTKEATGTDLPGAISLALGVLALAALGMGWFIHSKIYFAAAGISLVGFGVGFLGRGNLRIADCSLNFLILLPAVVFSAFFLARVPPVQEAPIVVVGPAVAADPVAEEPKWIDASGKSIQVGNVLVQINNVRLGKSKSVDVEKALKDAADLSNADLSDLSKPVPANNSVKEYAAILIDVLVGNPSETNKVDFKPWSKARGSYRLSDNRRNVYKPLAGSSDILGGLLGSGSSTETIKPKSTVVDALIFEELGIKLDYLKLELSAENFGGHGTIYFQIPKEMIQGQR